MEGYNVLTARQTTECRACSYSLSESFLSLGDMPLANNFPEDLDVDEKLYPLELTRCDHCYLVQLKHVVDPEILFRQYLYSSTSGLLEGHFDNLARFVSGLSDFEHDGLAVDIGSNDGLLLKCLKRRGFSSILGVEPATNLVEVARSNEVPTMHGFFSRSIADKILEQEGQPDLITATNVFAHIDDIRSLTENIKRLLRPNGILIIEVPYLPVMLDSGTVDLVYHEHLSYFSLTSLIKFFSSADMEIFRVDTIETHGGSVRILVQKKGAVRLVGDSVHEYISQEQYLSDPSTYHEFRRKVISMVDKFKADVEAIKSEGGGVVGYGAPAKASTLLRLASLDRNDLDYIVDDNNLKQGRYLPGTGIPIVDIDQLRNYPPRCVVILAWNLAESIIEKLKGYVREDTIFLVPFKETPKLRESVNLG